MTKSPSEIIDDTNIKYDIESVTEDLESYGIDIMKMINDVSSRFLQMEEIFNTVKSYNFGLLPYYIAQQIIRNYRIVDDFNVFVDDIISEYIINTVNYRFTSSDIQKVKLLILNLLMILSGKNIDTTDIVNKIDKLESLQQVVDIFSITKHDTYKAARLINDVYKKVCNHVDCDKHTVIMDIVKIWVKIFNVTEETLSVYKDDLGIEYYYYADYIISAEDTIDKTITNLNIDIDEMFYELFDLFVNENLNQLNNSSKNIAKLINSLSNNSSKYSQENFKIYIYTSFIIYHPYTMKIPSLNDYDQGNGRTAEFLVSKVYEDVINFYIFVHFANNTLEYSDILWNEWTNVKKDADKKVGRIYKGVITILNVNKFLLYLIKMICPSTYRPSKYSKQLFNNSKEYCHFITNKNLLNIYNILNIDARYIIINSTQQLTANKFSSTLIDWAQNLQVIYKPLKNLWNYYYKIKDDKKQDYKKFVIMESRVSDDITVNNYNIGGDLYSIFDNTFMLIDFKKYSEPKEHLYTKTLLQSWLYMNAYMKPLGMYNNQKLYSEYYLVAINPLLNHFISATYNDVTTFAEKFDLSDYKFADVNADANLSESE